MPSATRLLRELRARSVDLTLGPAGELRYDAPAGLMTSDLLLRIGAHRSELVAQLEAQGQARLERRLAGERWAAEQAHRRGEPMPSEEELQARARRALERARQRHAASRRRDQRATRAVARHLWRVDLPPAENIQEVDDT